MNIRDWITKAINPEKYYDNLLNKIIYSNYINNNMAVWYDSHKRSEYIRLGYQGNAMVYSIIKKITEKIKAADMYLYTDRPDRKSKRYREFKYSGNEIQHAIASGMRRKELELTEGTPLNDILENPNPWQTWDDFVETLAMFYYLTGEAFVYGVGPGEDSPNHGKYTELHILPSHLVSLVSSGDWRDPILGYKLIIGDQSITISKRNVHHFKMPNPNWDLNGTQLRGQSPLMAGFKYLKKNDSALEAWAKANQNEGAKGIISPNVQDPKLWPNPQQRQMLDDRIDERINGGGNMGRIVASSMPLRYDEIGMSPVALEILKGMQYDDEKLCGLWGISPLLFQPNATYANLLEAKKSLVTDIVIPFYNMIEKGLNEFFVKAYGDNLVIDADTSIYPELKPDLKLMKEVYGDAWQITGNEYREMVGFDAGEDPILDMHLIPAGLSLSSDFTDPDTSSDTRDYGEDQ